MGLNTSFLQTVLERVRGYLDEPDLDAKYSDSFLVDHMLGPSYTDVLSRVNLTSNIAIVSTFDVSLDADIKYYVLPPNIGMVLQLGIVDTDSNNLIIDVKPRNRLHPAGVGWAVEGNELYIPTPGDDQNIRVFYNPSGEVLSHYTSTGGILTTDSAGSTMVLDTTPTLGTMDTRENAYTGMVLRVFPSGRPVEERIIDSTSFSEGSSSVSTSDNTWSVTTRRPFTTTPDGTVPYEIGLPGMGALTEAIAARTALKLGSYRKISQTHREYIRQEYRQALKTAMDTLTNLLLRDPSAFEKNTIDNPNRAGFLGLTRL